LWLKNIVISYAQLSWAEFIAGSWTPRCSRGHRGVPGARHMLRVDGDPFADCPCRSIDPSGRMKNGTLMALKYRR
jgi:hypothetical protein